MAQQKFFELIPSGTNFQFIKVRWRFIGLSIAAIVLSVLALIYNQATTGAPLNFGIDFAGGSQIRLALAPDKDPGIAAIRESLDEFGFEGGSAVTVPEQEHEVLIRVKDVMSISEAQVAACEAAAGKVEGAKLIGFNHPEGSSKFFLKYDAEPSYQAVRDAINAAGCEGSADKGFGTEKGVYAVEFSLLGIAAKLQEELDAKFGDGTVTEVVRSETVGAKVGGQLKADAAEAMIYAIGFIFLYVMVRFDIRFAPGGIVALCHDAFLVVGAFAITGKEFNLQTIAAVLTVIGYSINDTIVVFDRIRERVALHRDESIEETTNTALNETLSRTILTSGTTMLVVIATWALGSGPIKDFSFALMVGIGVGTYSSVFMATPVFLWVNKRFYGGRGHLQWAENAAREGTGKLLGDDGQAPGEIVAHEPGPDADPALEGREPDVVEEGKRRASRRRRRRPDDAPPST